MKLSIILPVYNVEPYIKQCVNSILSQTFEDYEIIFVEDCSTDDSLRLLEEYAKKDEKIKLIKNKKNLGAGLSRNIGLEAAGGEYVHFVDSDDWLVDNYVYEKLISRINSLDYVPDVVAFRYNIFNNNTEELTELKFTNADIFEQNINPTKNIIAFDNWDRYVWQKFHRREFLTKNNIVFNNHHSLEDMEHSAMVYVKAKSLCYIDLPMVNYRFFRKGSLIYDGYKSIKTIIKSFENNKILYKNMPAAIQNLLLGFDYYQIKNCLEPAYMEGCISTLDVIKTWIKHRNTDGYTYNRFRDEEDKTLKINFIKLIIKRDFPKLFHFLVLLKKRL